MNSIHSSVVSVWNNMRSAISGVINQIVSTIRNGLNQAVSFVKGLIGQAFSWGRDLIMGIVNGIRNAIGAVANACRSVADTIRSYLHFSVPDIGPLTDYESWMPDFMKGLAKGIEKSKGLVSDAMEGVTAGMNLSPVLAASAPAMAESVTRGGDAGLLQRLSDAVSQLSGQNGDITIPVYIGQDRIDEIVVTAAQRATYRSGGR
jgi:phage-related protein